MKLIHKYIPDVKKQKNAVPELLALAKKGKPISKSRIGRILATSQYNLVFDGQKYSAAKIEKTANELNPSLYLFQAEALYYGVKLLDNNNAQKEYYLTDIVAHLASAEKGDGKAKFKVVPIVASDENVIQGFNSPDELLAIQDYIRSKKARSVQSGIAAKPHLARIDI